MFYISISGSWPYQLHPDFQISSYSLLLGFHIIMLTDSSLTHKAALDL